MTLRVRVVATKEPVLDSESLISWMVQKGSFQFPAENQQVMAKNQQVMAVQLGRIRLQGTNMASSIQEIVKHSA